MHFQAWHFLGFFTNMAVVLFRIAFSRFWRKIVKWRQKSLKTTKKLKKRTFRQKSLKTTKKLKNRQKSWKSCFRSTSFHFSTFSTFLSLFQLFCRFQIFWRFFNFFALFQLFCRFQTFLAKSTLFQLFCRFQAFWRHSTILSSKTWESDPEQYTKLFCWFL